MRPADTQLELTDAKRRVLERLKRVESATAPELAAAFGNTDTAARQHLEALEAAGLVERVVVETQGRGRPPVSWRLSQAATGAFPDHHRDLAGDLITVIRDTLGEDALQHLIDARTSRQRDRYRAELDAQPVAVRVRRLADLRTGEGYMAEITDTDDGWVLTEHHCPICDAATSCQGFCRAELELFRSALGPDVEVERQQHLLSGDSRCSYVITKR